LIEYGEHRKRESTIHYPDVERLRKTRAPNDDLPSALAENKGVANRREKQPRRAARGKKERLPAHEEKKIPGKE
jgi:hypothetical protein